MVLKYDPQVILHEPSLEQVQSELERAALEFALLGRVDTARELHEIFRGSSPIVQPEGALLFAWKQTGKWPEGLTEDHDAISVMQDLTSTYIECWPQDVPEQYHNFDQEGLDACLNVSDNQFADSTTGWEAMKKGDRLVKALDISIRLYEEESGPRRSERLRKNRNKEDQLPIPSTSTSVCTATLADLDSRSVDLVGKIASRWSANSQISYLSRAESLWPYYANGLLAEALGLEAEELKTKGEMLVDAFRNRLKTGHAPTIFAGKTIRELLDIGESNTCSKTGPARTWWLEQDIDPPETLYNERATESEIEELEQRLGTVLPDDYKEFLRISNGFGSEEDGGIFDGWSQGPPLHSAEDVHWDEEPAFQLPVELLEITREIEDLALHETKWNSDESLDWQTALPLFDRVLEIGIIDIDNVWLVHPQLVEQCRSAYHEMYTKGDERQKKVIVRAMEAFAGSKENFEALHWCCVTWTSGGPATMRAYSSFTKYLEDVVSWSMEDMIAEVD